MQLAGHLQGRALLEWNLLKDSEKDGMEKTVAALQNQRDEDGRVLVAQDFQHSLQKAGETVADFNRQLESTFKIAYGWDGMAADTRDTLLHGQLQEGLGYELMRSPTSLRSTNVHGVIMLSSQSQK